MMCRRRLHLHVYFHGHGSLFWEEGAGCATMKIIPSHKTYVWVRSCLESLTRYSFIRWGSLELIYLMYVNTVRWYIRFELFRLTQHIFFSSGNWLQRFNMKSHHYKPPDLTELTCGNNWWKYHISVFGSFSGIIFVNLPKNIQTLYFKKMKKNKNIR